MIGDNVDIGQNAQILGGITVADGVRIGAGAIVTKSILIPDVTVVGIPAKVIRKMNHVIVEDKLRDTNPVPVVIAFTPNYFIPASTCLYSIFASLDIEEQMHVICLLSEELPDRLKQKIQLIGGERAQYSFINLQGRLQNIYIDAKYTEAASYRLLLPDLLPEYDKVMYIDCDIIVRNNLVKLYRSVDLGIIIWLRI